MNFKSKLLVAPVMIALGFGLFSGPQPASAWSGGKEGKISQGVGDSTVKNSVPFKGAYLGNDTIVPPLTIATASTGGGTLFGKISLTQAVTIDPSDFSFEGSAQWIAANGDSIDTTIEGSAIPGPVVFTITETHTITGGTGRFAGAEGSFTVHRSHVVATNDDGTHVTYAWFEGSISSPGLTF